MLIVLHSLSLVHFLLDEIVGSTVHRCLDAVTMEPSVSDCYHTSLSNSKCTFLTNPAATDLALVELNTNFLITDSMKIV